MKISELPEPYRSLAELREMQYHENNTDRALIHAFHFDGTPEGVFFWADVLYGQTPAIPEISLAELEDYT